MKLKGKVAVITGSSRGIGKSAALLFANEGAKVVVNFRENKKAAQEVVNEIKKNGGEAILVQADVSNPKDVKKMFETVVKQFRTVDILVNNAGIYSSKPFLETTFEDIEKIMLTNFVGTFMCSQEAAKLMLKQKQGKIINIASVKGIEHCAKSRRIEYSASKAAVINFTKALSAELAPHINVNAVAPGFVETEMAKTWPEENKKRIVEETCLKRLVQPEEVAKAILYLASDDSSAVTGEVLVVDGGYNLK